MPNLSNGTYCALPFIQKYQNLDGNKYLCCRSNIPIDGDITDLQQKIIAGEKIPHCEVCYRAEAARTISYRLQESVPWMKIPEVKEYLDTWTPTTPTKTYFFDIRHSNKCNLSCISCKPTNSSLWAKELNVEVPEYTLEFTNEELLAAKKIYFAGGEPLIIDEYIDIILLIAEQEVQPELIINTNLTTINEKLQAKLSKIKNLTLTVSVDAYGLVNDYHRYPIRWDKFIRNLEWTRENIDCTIRLNSVVDAVSIFGLADLVQIEHLIDQWDLAILSTPPALAVNNLPTHLKYIAIEKFSRITTSKVYKQDPIFKSRVNMIPDLINKSGDPELLALYIKELDSRRNIDHENYIGYKLT